MSAFGIIAIIVGLVAVFFLGTGLFSGFISAAILTVAFKNRENGWKYALSCFVGVMIIGTLARYFIMTSAGNPMEFNVLGLVLYLLPGLLIVWGERWNRKHATANEEPEANVTDATSPDEKRQEP